MHTHYTDSHRGIDAYTLHRLKQRYRCIHTTQTLTEVYMHTHYTDSNRGIDAYTLHRLSRRYRCIHTTQTLTEV